VLRITGRIKELIIKAGENLSPQSIEEALYQHPLIEEAAVIGQPDERLGEKVVAVVKQADGLTATGVITHCRGLLKGLYVPDEVVFLPELPKTATGKIAKKLIMQQFQNLSPAS
jgi:fatty-acyl-CoA synthase